MRPEGVIYVFTCLWLLPGQCRGWGVILEDKSLSLSFFFFFFFKAEVEELGR